VIIELPFRPSVAHYRFGTAIGDFAYIFDVHWNSRDNFDPETGKAAGAWYFAVREQNLELIISSVKIVLGTYLGRRRNHRLFRQGVFVVCDTTGKGKEAGFDDLGPRVAVRYIPQNDLLVLTR
jgi:hypothetical protein